MEIKRVMDADACKEAIKDLDDVKDFIKTIIVDEKIGLAFHPDDGFDDYVKRNGDNYYD